MLCPGSLEAVNLWMAACPRASARSVHTFWNVTGLGKWSGKCLPNNSSDGDAPISGGGVLRWRSRALATASVSRDPPAWGNVF